MKNLIVILLMLVSTLSYSQSSIICLSVDEFSDKKNYLVEDRVITSLPDDKDKGVIWDVYFKEGKKGNVEINSLMLSVFGLGCIEKGSELYIIFEDGEKIKLTNWNKFNCKGNFWCSYEDDLNTKKIKKVKITNKNNYESYVFDVSGKELSDFFVNVYNDLIEGTENGFKTCP